MSKPHTVTVATLANFLMVTERRVQQLAKEGIVRKDDRGEYELTTSIQGYIRFLQETTKSGNGGSEELQKSKARMAEAKARKAEIEVRQMEGELVPASDVSKAWIEMVAHMRAKLLSLPNKLAPQLMGGRTLNEINALLQTTIKEALQELAGTDIIIQAPADGSSDDSEAGL